MLHIKGFDRLNQKLQRLARIGLETKPLMADLANALRNEIELSFERKTSPFGKKWQALKPATLKQKLAKNKSPLILRREGSLADRWHLSLSATQAIVSNNSKSSNDFSYGLVHQYGSKSKNIPARQFLPVNSSGKMPQALRAEFRGLMIEFIKDRLK